MSRHQIAPFRSLAPLAFVIMSMLSGCSDNSSTSAQFGQSATANAPGTIKLVSGGSSGSRVLVHVVLFGPEPDLDLFAFRFGVAIGDPNLAGLVPASSFSQTTLTPDAGQTISIDVDGSDPSIVKVDVEKQGGGSGNGIAAAATIVIDLTFEVRAAGTTTLTLVGLGGQAPEALDSHFVVIDGVTFDAASAGISGVRSGGGY